MKYLLSILFCFQCSWLGAAETQTSRRVFVVETDAKSAAESLDRISGEIDLGFSKSDQTFESSDHYAPGPFGRQKQADQSRA